MNVFQRSFNLGFQGKYSPTPNKDPGKYYLNQMVLMNMLSSTYYHSASFEN